MYDVAIIGCGPTGATLANLLAKSGVSVLILDREAQMYHLPRAVHFDDEVMRVFQTVGIADDLAKKVHINPGMKFVDEAGTLLLDWPRPQEITSHGWHASYRLHQPDLEQLLRQKLAAHPNIEFVSDFNVTDLDQHSDHVRLGGTDRTTGQNQEYAARYCVGCDGANSFVRKAISAEMDDYGFEERWLVIDLLLKRPRPDLGDHSIQFCNPDRPMTYCRSPGMRRRWEITVKDGETDAEISDPKTVWAMLAKWITPDDADLERSAVYTFNSQVAKTWRDQRVLLAGDAAHLTPPFMGQGMCTGIRDAANLSWKLSAVLKRSASENLLNSYEQERAPHAREYVKAAMRLGGLINSIDRDSALDMAEGRTKMRSIAPKLGQSPVMQSQSAAENDPVGRPFAQMRMADGTRFDDFANGAHVLISRNPAAAPSAPTIKVIDASNHPEVRSELDQMALRAIWVRPDGYIGAIADELATLLDLLRSNGLIDDPSQ